MFIKLVENSGVIIVHNADDGFGGKKRRQGGDLEGVAKRDLKDMDAVGEKTHIEDISMIKREIGVALTGLLPQGEIVFDAKDVEVRIGSTEESRGVAGLTIKIDAEMGDRQRMDRLVVIENRTRG